MASQKSKNQNIIPAFNVIRERVEVTQETRKSCFAAEKENKNWDVCNKLKLNDIKQKFKFG